MNEIRYLPDENVDPVLRTELLKRESKMSVWKIGDPGAPPRNTADPDILRWCEENNFILITHNRESMPRHLAEHLANHRHVPGIFELNPNMSLGETIMN